MKDSLVYIDNILDAMEKAEAFVSGMEYNQFEKDTRTVFPVIRTLEIIGEAVKRLPSEFRERYPHIPWKDIAGRIKSYTATMRWTCASCGKRYDRIFPG